MEFMYQRLTSEATNADANYILDAVLNNIDQIMDGMMDDDRDRCSSSDNDSIPSNKLYVPSTALLSQLSSSSSSGSTGSFSNFNTKSNKTAFRNVEYTSNMSNGVTRVSAFKLDNNAKVELKDNIYISKDCTYHLRQYVVEEDWGKDINLYKYLDYIFRCQLFSKQIMLFEHQSRARYLIFNSGLQRRSDHAFLFVLSTPNFAQKPQKWRVQIGNVNNSFLSQDELLQKLRGSELELDVECLSLPRAPSVMNSRYSEYNPTYSIVVNWEERLTTIEDRIYGIIGGAAFFDKSCKYLKLSALIAAFESSLSTTKILCALNPQLAVPQGFVDSKRRKYRIELLLPLVVKFGGVSHTFALAISHSTQYAHTYSVKSILTLNMGYSNARLVGYVKSKWLVRQSI
eukprot:452926_1